MMSSYNDIGEGDDNRAGETPEFVSNVSIVFIWSTQGLFKFMVDESTILLSAVRRRQWRPYLGTIWTMNSFPFTSC